MTKKAISKVLACACVATMAISFGSCASEPASVDQSSTDPSFSDSSTSDTSDKASDTSQTQLPQSTSEATKADVGETTNSVQGISKPTDTASAVRLYNDAVAKKGTVSATVSREMLGGNVAVFEIATLAPTAADQFRLTNAPLEGADLYAIDAGSVAGTDVQEVGDNYVITFTLNDTILNNSSAHGEGGFMYFLDVPVISETINLIGRSIMNDPNYDFTVKEDKVEISATEGRLVVTINKNTGNLSSAEVAFTEDIKVPLSKPIPGTAKVQCKGSAKYTVA